MQRALVAILLLAGCVTDPNEPPPPACTNSGECPTGQTCRDNQCFGGAPGEFSAELFAPASRSDMLARAEIKKLEISQSGDVSVMFARSIEVTGTVLLRSEDTTSSAARVVFRRPSRITGAPDYVVSVDALPGKNKTEAAFRARITPNEGSEKYEITVYPDDGTLQQPREGSLPPNALAPPTLIKLPLTDNRFLPITLDAGGLKGLAGSVLDAVGNGKPDMLVRAYGRRTLTGPLELVSSTARTGSDGRFQLYLPVADAALFDLVVTPAPNNHQPSLTRKAVRVTADMLVAGTTSTLTSVMYPALPGTVLYQLPVMGPDSAGGRRAAVGATVSFWATLSTTVGTQDTVVYETQTTVGSDGLAKVELVPGSLDRNRMYKVTVVPLPNAQQGTRWDAELAIGPDGGATVLPELELPKRVLVTGRVVDAEGMPAAKMNVRPQFASSFLASLGSDSLARVLAIGLPEVTTNETTGAFTVYLDATLVGGLAPTYDLELVPPSASRLPRWSRDGVILTGATDSKLDLKDTGLPRTSLASGIVRDEDGEPVPDAEVRVYMRDAGSAARLRTLAKSDQAGNVVLVLPSP